MNDALLKSFPLMLFSRYIFCEHHEYMAETAQKGILLRLDSLLLKSNDYADASLIFMPWYL